MNEEVKKKERRKERRVKKEKWKKERRPKKAGDGLCEEERERKWGQREERPAHKDIEIEELDQEW